MNTTTLGRWFGFGRDQQYDRGLRAFDSELYDEAIEAFAICISSSYDSATIRLAKFYIAESFSALGQRQMQHDQFELAADYFARALEMQPNYPDLHHYLAQVYHKMRDPERLEIQIQRALAINPNYASAILLQGVSWYEAGRLEEGLARIHEAARLDPKLDGEHYRAGLEAHRHQESQRALAHFEAMGRQPDTANELAKMGDHFASKKLWEEAAQQYEKALAIAPGYADIHCKLGQIWLEMGRVEPALKCFSRAAEINPNYADAFAYQGVAFKRLGQDSEARRAFLRATEIHPNHPVAEHELGRLATS